MSPVAPTKDQFAGALVGQALGDALGFIVEGHPPDVCRAYVDDVLRTGRGGRGRRGGLPVGQYSDDTQLAREILISFVELGDFEPADLAQRIAAIFSEGRIVGRGQSTSAAATRLAAGVSWQDAGTPPPSAGNGSAMRAGPIGLLYFDDHDRLAAAAHDQSRMTHADLRCSAGSVAIAGAVALAMTLPQFEPEAVADTLSPLVAEFDPPCAALLAHLADWIELRPDQAVQEIGASGFPEGYVRVWPGISPYVIPTILWSLYSALRTPDDYWEAVCTAIAVGGDVDTTAAITGAIVGALLGADALPRDVARTVNDQGTWGHDDLVALAHRTWEIKTHGAPAAAIT